MRWNWKWNPEKPWRLPASMAEFYPCETAAALRCQSLAGPVEAVEVAPGVWAIVTRFMKFDRLTGIIERDSGGVRYYCGSGVFVDDPEITEDVVVRDSYSTWFRPRLLTGFGG